ncbi:MAG: hypothetical protein LBG06_06140 [Deltaproteobacteria bacterium]|jgi:hypothetical protein|nr:hypothetical protein [Deltaproteobacteria bacterium]
MFGEDLSGAERAHIAATVRARAQRDLVIAQERVNEEWRRRLREAPRQRTISEANRLEAEWYRENDARKPRARLKAPGFRHFWDKALRHFGYTEEDVAIDQDRDREGGRLWMEVMRDLGVTPGSLVLDERSIRDRIDETVGAAEEAIRELVRRVDEVPDDVPEFIRKRWPDRYLPKRGRLAELLRGSPRQLAEVARHAVSDVIHDLNLNRKSRIALESLYRRARAMGVDSNLDRIVSDGREYTAEDDARVRRRLEASVRDILDRTPLAEARRRVAAAHVTGLYWKCSQTIADILTVNGHKFSAGKVLDMFRVEYGRPSTHRVPEENALAAGHYSPLDRTIRIFDEGLKGAYTVSALLHEFFHGMHFLTADLAAAGMPQAWDLLAPLADESGVSELEAPEAWFRGKYRTRPGEVMARAFEV